MSGRINWNSDWKWTNFLVKTIILVEISRTTDNQNFDWYNQNFLILFSELFLVHIYMFSIRITR